MSKPLDKTTVSKVFEDAGREFARAATNVVDQVAAELSGKKKHESHAPPPHEERHEPHAAPKAHDEDDEFDGVKPTTPRGPTAEDPSFRLAVDDDDEKKSG